MLRFSSQCVLSKVQAFCKRNGVGNSNVLVAVSGGPDSICLLHAMTQVVDPEKLHVAHYNHHLRGDASEADSKYVRQLCIQHSLTCHLGNAAPGELTPGQSHLESQARWLRYRWFSELASHLHCDWVMTGHTMNDQAETVLHHLIRGTGWRGLRGIAPIRLLPTQERPGAFLPSPLRGEGPGVRGSFLPSPLEGEGLGVRGSMIEFNPVEKPQTIQHELNPLRNPSPLTPLPGGERGTRLLRPLLACTRQDILDYLKLNNLTPRHDASNDDLRFTRNRLRHQVLPKLMGTKPDIVQHLAQWANIARKHYSALAQAARQAEQQALVHRTEHALALKQQAMQSLSEDELQVLLHRLWRNQRWAQDAMNAQRWQEVMEVCHGTRTAVELPGRIMVRNKHQVIQITKPMD